MDGLDGLPGGRTTGAPGGPMGLGELVSLGEQTLLAMALAGRLRPSHLWVAAKGAGRYRAAVRAGDIAAEGVARARAAGVCAGCPAAVAERVAGVPGLEEKLWCGPPLEERLQGPAGERRCGCLVALRVNGEVVAAGRTVVGSETCPRGLW